MTSISSKPSMTRSGPWCATRPSPRSGAGPRVHDNAHIEEEPMMRRILALVCLLAALCAAPLAEAQPVKLRIGWAITPAQMHPVIFANTGVLKHYGKSYTVDLVYFRGSTPQITALASGDLDISALAFSSFGLAIQNAHMNDLRVIGDLY